MFLNDKSCMVRLTLIDISPNELKCYPLMISLNECTVSCNVIYVKSFNIITNKDEAKAVAEHIQVVVNGNSIIQHVIQNKNGIIKHVNVTAKIFISQKKIIVGILAHVFVR